MDFKVNDFITIKKATIGTKPFYFEGLYAEIPFYEIIGFIENDKVKGFLNSKTENIFKL